MKRDREHETGYRVSYDLLQANNDLLQDLKSPDALNHIQVLLRRLKRRKRKWRTEAIQEKGSLNCEELEALVKYIPKYLLQF